MPMTFVGLGVQQVKNIQEPQGLSDPAQFRSAQLRDAPIVGVDWGRIRPSVR